MATTTTDAAPAAASPAVEDLLSTVMSTYQVRAEVSANPQFCGAFEMPEPELANAVFHLIDRGSAVLSSAVLPAPLVVSTGDLVVVPRGTAHVLRSPPGQRSDCWTALLCGHLRFTGVKHHPVLHALPEFLVVRRECSGDALRCVAELMTQTARDLRIGRQAVLDKLADTLFVMAVQQHMADSKDPRGILAAMVDHRLARALSAIHREPGTDWTVASLAQAAAMSRTAFAERFSEVLGVSPIQYLTEWRMARAERLLRDSRQSVAAVAAQLGYQTEAAFRRSFKRVHGYGPGAVRKEAA